MKLDFIVPGDLNAPTGGYAYARRAIAGLREAGDDVNVVSLPGDYPTPDATARARAGDRFAAIADGQTVLVDGLALGALAHEAGAHARRLKLVALVHHPLFLETGLTAEQRHALFSTERSALGHCRCIVTTSHATAQNITRRFGIAAEHIHVAPPGTDRREPAQGSGQRWTQLLCVASVVPRKGHQCLFDALAGIAHLDWRLRCVGALDRHAAHAVQMRQHAIDCGLTDRVEWSGAVDHAALEHFWSTSDVFVLASEHEGYGMAFAEALSAGLPIVGTTAAVVPELRMSGARLVAAGDVGALRQALTDLIGDPGARLTAARAARVAARALPRWPETIQVLRRVLSTVGGQPIDSSTP